MAKALSLGNGSILVNIGLRGEVRDFYFPYVGLENQIGGHFSHRVGVYADRTLSWLSDDDWQINVSSENESLIGKTEARNERLGVELHFTDAVYNERNIFIRKISVRNTRSDSRPIKIFFGHQFEPYESHSAHTAYFDPRLPAIIHYRNRRAFLIAATLEGRPFDDWSTGVFDSDGKEGTHIDAVDGELEKNPIEHGQADSVIGLGATYGPNEEKRVDYWLTAAESIKEAMELHSYVQTKGISHLVETTRNFWTAWVNRRNFSFYGLSPEVISLFKKSLFIIRAHVDARGGIIASGDSNMLQQGKDTYAYVWPRDASLAALALAMAGDFNNAKQFFKFLSSVVTAEGYFMHKYSPDGSLGSSWHPWVRNGHLELPIQEDETAMPLIALWQYYELSRDLEFIEEVYEPLIKRPADFMVTFRDEATELPKGTYDLWEEKFGTTTFTAAAVAEGLTAAASFAKLLGKVKSEHLYRAAATAVKEATFKHLWDAKRRSFRKLVRFDGETGFYDDTPDASNLHGPIVFNLVSLSGEDVAEAVATARRELWVRGPIGGMSRYRGDNYYRRQPDVPGNPWTVTTLWLARWLIRLAKNESDLVEAREIFEWLTAKAFASGILPEQVDPDTGAPLSVAPLVWSHAEFVIAVTEYLNKLETLGVCRACNPVD